mgnify:CR=1 FL=1
MSAKLSNKNEAPEVFRFYVSRPPHRGKLSSFVSLEEYEELRYKYETLKAKYK